MEKTRLWVQMQKGIFSSLFVCDIGKPLIWEWPIFYKRIPQLRIGFSFEKWGGATFFYIQRTDKTQEAYPLGCLLKPQHSSPHRLTCYLLHLAVLAWVFVIGSKAIIWRRTYLGRGLGFSVSCETPNSQSSFFPYFSAVDIGLTREVAYSSGGVWNHCTALLNASQSCKSLL